MDPKVLLLVEDNRADVDLTTIALDECGVANQLVVARDGAEALDYFSCRGRFASRDPKSLPAVVLLDLKLPKVSGLEVLEAIRTGASTKLLPVVILTTSNSEEDRQAAYERGCNGYVRKPADYVHFAEAVKNLGQYWLVHNAEPPRASER